MEDGFVPPRNDEFVRGRITLAFSAQDRARMMEHLGAERAATVCAELQISEYSEAEARWLVHQVREATVGTRLVLAGPETEILAARTDAVQAGMVSSEILLLAREDESSRVYCPHCRTLTRTSRPVEQIAVCGGCRRELEVFDHFSRGLSAYLGAEANAEELT